VQVEELHLGQLKDHLRSRRPRLPRTLSGLKASYNTHNLTDVT
jgi:hypothetical protein